MPLEPTDVSRSTIPNLLHARIAVSDGPLQHLAGSPLSLHSPGAIRLASVPSTGLTHTGILSFISPAHRGRFDPTFAISARISYLGRVSYVSSVERKSLRTIVVKDQSHPTPACPRARYNSYLRGPPRPLYAATAPGFGVLTIVPAVEKATRLDPRRPQNIAATPFGNLSPRTVGPIGCNLRTCVTWLASKFLLNDRRPFPDPCSPVTLVPATVAGRRRPCLPILVRVPSGTPMLRNCLLPLLANATAWLRQSRLATDRRDEGGLWNARLHRHFETVARSKSHSGKRGPSSSPALTVVDMPSTMKYTAPPVLLNHLPGRGVIKAARSLGYLRSAVFSVRSGKDGKHQPFITGMSVTGEHYKTRHVPRLGSRHV